MSREASYGALFDRVVVLGKNSERRIMYAKSAQPRSNSMAFKDIIERT